MDPNQTNPQKEKKSKRIIITRKEMDSAFRSHVKTWEEARNVPFEKLKQNHCRKMILFYTVECGLKAYFMSKKNLESTEMETDSTTISGLGHNLNKILVQLKMNFEIPPITKNTDKPVECLHLHQAWRYGKDLDAGQEIECLKKLVNILNELVNRFNGGSEWKN